MAPVPLIALCLLLMVPVARAEERTLYSCSFEDGAGIFRLEAVGPGAMADLVRHQGNGCVKLARGDAGPPVPPVHVWGTFAEAASRASVQWARHWAPDNPFVLRKDHTYEVRARVKLEAPSALGIRLAVWARDGTPVRGQAERYSPILGGPSDWGVLSARVACTEGDGELRDITIALLSSGTAWVDDVSVVEYAQVDMPSINYGHYPPMRLVELRAESAACLALEFLGDLDCVAAERLENWLVLSDEDEAFTEGIRPDRIGRTKQLDNPTGRLVWQDAYRHTIFLLLPTPLRSGSRYTVAMLNIGAERQEFDIAFDEQHSLSRSIKTNQYGYLPDAFKYAYLGGWLGTAGPLPLEGVAEEFRVVDEATDEVVFTGPRTLRMRHDQQEPLSTSVAGNLTGEDVYELDFSALAAPGQYFIVVPGVGRSFGFRIGGDVYAEPFYHCARAMLHQRCGTGLGEPSSKYTRGPCHRNPGTVIRANIVENGNEDQDQLVKENPSIKTDRTVNAWGGYHDAADYDRLVGHYRVPATLMQLYEMSPAAFTDGQLDLPESGNGLPDIVDEALWQVDFGVVMQDPGDGGVYGGAGPNAVVTAPADRDENPIYVYDKDPLTSLCFAGVAAQAARVLGELGKTKRAAEYLDRARRAWEYAAKHDGTRFTIPYAFAALELFRATGDDRFRQAFLAMSDKVIELGPLAQAMHQGVFVWNVWLSCVAAEGQGIAPELAARCRDRIVAAAEKEIQVMESNAYRMPNWIGPPARYGWGCGTNFPGGEFLVMAWRITGQKRYRDYALLAADFSLGCHPTGTVYITGLGKRHVKWAMHPFSDPMASQIGAPVEDTLPGLPLFAVHGYPQSFSGWQTQLLYVYANPSRGVDNFHPPSSEWPDLRLFADVGWVPILSEHTVASTMLHTTFMYGALLAAGQEAVGARH